jgi:hypothetical protein
VGWHPARAGELSGDFEIHLTTLHGADELSAFAGRHGVKFSHILLDGGAVQSQPMLTLRGRGSLTEILAVARDWERRLGKVQLYPP